ncbi:MAG: protease PrsW [Candidatus Thermoplasmatota archaeon]|nr:protease PrsW [Candidatus Thermoplasmatota archaeon]
MSLSILPQSSLFLGIIPALILIYISLKDWQGEYVEKTLFIMFVFGIILGFIAALVEIFTVSSGILLVVLFPVLEQVMKLAVLNLRRFHGKRSTVIYGLSIGLGFGSIFTPVSMILASVEAISNVALLAILLGSIGIIFIHGATGAIIGYGVYEEKTFTYYIYAVLIHLPVTLWFFLTGYYNMSQLQVGIIVYGIIVYWYVKKQIIENVLKQTENRKRTRQPVP